MQYGDDGYEFQRKRSIKIVSYYRKFMFQLRPKRGKVFKIEREEVEKEARRMESGGDQAHGWEIQLVICQQLIKDGQGCVA